MMTRICGWTTGIGTVTGTGTRVLKFEPFKEPDKVKVQGIWGQIEVEPKLNYGDVIIKLIII